MGHATTLTKFTLRVIFFLSQIYFFLKNRKDPLVKYIALLLLGYTYVGNGPET